MPIIGVIDSAKTGNLVIPFNYYSIATGTVDSGNSATISFTAIPQTYTHLQLRAFTQGSRTSGLDTQFYAQFGHGTLDTGANYVDHGVYGQGRTSSTVFTSYNNGGGTSIMPANNSGTQTAGNFGASIWDILDYTNTNKYKTVRILSGEDPNSTASYEGTIGLTSGLWINTNSIDTIQLTMSGYNFKQYSQIALYGVK